MTVSTTCRAIGNSASTICCRLQCRQYCTAAVTAVNTVLSTTNTAANRTAIVANNSKCRRFICTAANRSNSTINPSSTVVLSNKVYDIESLPICRLIHTNNQSVPAAAAAAVDTNTASAVAAVDNSTRNIPASAVPTSTKCWQCSYEFCNNTNSPSPSLYCAACGLPQTSALTIDYFTLLQIPPTYSIQLTAIDSSYKRLQKKLHPDRFTNSNPIKQRISAALSCRVNEAVTVLKDNYQRARYLLILLNQQYPNIVPKLDSEDSATTATNTVNPNLELLMQIMEIREELESIPIVNNIHHKLTEQQLNQLNQLNTSNTARLQSINRELTIAFDQQEYNRIIELISELSYFNNIQQEIHKRTIQT